MKIPQWMKQVRRGFITDLNAHEVTPSLFPVAVWTLVGSTAAIGNSPTDGLKGAAIFFAGSFIYSCLIAYGRPERHDRRAQRRARNLLPRED